MTQPTAAQIAGARPRTDAGLGAHTVGAPMAARCP
jgi:hypothetical protein